MSDDRKTRALRRNYFDLMEKLNKSTQAWTAKLTGIQHWKPETGYDVFIFDPNNLGETYVLLRRWNESKMAFDEEIKKHKTGRTDPASAVQETKDWVSNNWDSLKNFKADDNKKTDNDKQEAQPNDDVSQEPSPPSQTSLDSKIEEAYEDVTEEELCRFENFLDDGIPTDEEKEEIWRHPWLRRLNNQINEMQKDHSQYERAMQQRRDKALEKSLPNLMDKLSQIKEKELVQ
jgi:hypothetical protein